MLVLSVILTMSGRHRAGSSLINHNRLFSTRVWSTKVFGGGLRIKSSNRMLLKDLLRMIARKYKDVVLKDNK